MGFDKGKCITAYALARFPMFSLLGPEPSKIPAISMWQRTEWNPLIYTDELPYNYGVVIPDGYVVLDIDARAFMDGDDPFVRLKAALGMAPGAEFDTLTVRTRRYKDRHDGWHIYFKKPPNWPIMIHNPEFGKAIQALSSGHFVVGPGSIHPETKEPYEVIHGSPDKIMDASKELLALFTKVDTPKKGVERFEDSPQTRARFIDFLASRPHAIQGQSGDDWTLKTAMAGRDIGLPEEATFDLMHALWNPYCSPPWSAIDLKTKVKNAYAYAKDGIGNKHPAAVFDLFTKQEIPANRLEKAEEISREAQNERDRAESAEIHQIKWIYKPNHKTYEFKYLENTIKNVVNFLSLPHHKTYVNVLYDLVKYNLFTHRIEFKRRPPWYVKGVPYKYWDDADAVQLRAWLSENPGFNPTEANIDAAVYTYAMRNAYHPLKDWFKTLKWDGVPRLRRLLPDYAGTDDNLYTQEIGYRWMISIIARVMDPGCKVDHMLILEGPQGAQKSQFLEVLAGKEYHAEMILDPRNKDCRQALRGKTIIELGEMSHLRRSEEEEVKLFLTTRSDWVRLPYAADMAELPRSCVFAGNTNRTDAYLKDKTGNRRYWMARVGIVIQLEKLRHDREQLYAEAYWLWASGEPWWILDKDTQKLVVEQQSQRVDSDVWVDVILSWLDSEIKQGRAHERLASLDIAINALNLPVKSIDRTVLTRIQDSMVAIGWSKLQFRHRGVSCRGFENPYYAEQLTQAAVFKGQKSS